MQQPIPAGESMKEQVVDTVPKRIKELKFGILYGYLITGLNDHPVDNFLQLQTRHRQPGSPRSL